MDLSKVKALVVVFVLFFLVGILTVGCKQKTQNAWVNTASLPGQTFSDGKKERPNNPQIVYLGNDSATQRENFGPREVDFNFENLK